MRLGTEVAGVLFDLDDTLVDHRGASRDALAAWIGESGLPGSLDELQRRWVSLETHYYARFQRRELTKDQQRHARVRAFIGNELLDDAAAQAMFAAYWRNYQRNWRAFADAASALRRIQASGRRVAILTNGDVRDQRAKLVAAGLDTLGVPLYASSDLPASKPDARAFLAACKQIHVRPSQCLMVGDSWSNDILGGRAAGLHAILLDRAGEASNHGVECIRSLDELVVDERATP